jgi:DNA repair exonuclease SbcCD ATPase subunit
MTIIWQISDLHICDGFYDSILHAIRQFVERVKKGGGDLITIVGDVFDNKSKISQADISCFNQILDVLPLKTVIIPGNHDYKGDLDFMRVLITKDNKLSERVLVYSKTGLYQLPGLDIDFYVASPIDKIEPKIIKSDRLKILLIHEPVKGCKSYGSVEFADARFSVTDLCKKYDIIMAGDIHKPQILQGKFAYSGSLVQRNRGEELEHGYVKWIIEGKQVNAKFEKLKLLTAFIRLKAPNIKFPDPALFDKAKSVELTHSIEDPKQLDILIKQIEEKYKMHPTVRFIAPPGKNEIKEDQNSDPNYVAAVETSLEKYPYKPEILAIHKQFLKEISEDVDRIHTWHLNFLYWSNVMCYGEHNFINFKSLHGIVPLIGKNKTGKSTIIDILLLALFNIFQRGTRDYVMNSRKKEYKIICGFSSDMQKYMITRETTMINKKCKQKVSLVQEGADNVWDDVSGADIVSTYAKIKELIGSVNDFLNVNVSTQDNMSIVTKKPDDQMIELRSYLFLQKFDIIEKLVAEKLREIRVLIKDMGTIDEVKKPDQLLVARLKIEEHDARKKMIFLRVELEKNIRKIYKPEEKNIEEKYKAAAAAPIAAEGLTKDELQNKINKLQQSKKPLPDWFDPEKEALQKIMTKSNKTQLAEQLLEQTIKDEELIEKLYGDRPSYDKNIIGHKYTKPETNLGDLKIEKDKLQTLIGNIGKKFIPVTSNIIANAADLLSSEELVKTKQLLVTYGKLVMPKIISEIGINYKFRQKTLIDEDINAEQETIHDLEKKIAIIDSYSKYFKVGKATKKYELPISFLKEASERANELELKIQPYRKLPKPEEIEKPKTPIDELLRMKEKAAFGRHKKFMKFNDECTSCRHNNNYISKTPDPTPIEPLLKQWNDYKKWCEYQENAAIFEANEKIKTELIILRDKVFHISCNSVTTREVYSTELKKSRDKLGSLKKEATLDQYKDKVLEWLEVATNSTVVREKLEKHNAAHNMKFSTEQQECEEQLEQCKKQIKEHQEMDQLGKQLAAQEEAKKIDDKINILKEKCRKNKKIAVALKAAQIYLNNIDIDKHLQIAQANLQGVKNREDRDKYAAMLQKLRANKELEATVIQYKSEINLLETKIATLIKQTHEMDKAQQQYKIYEELIKKRRKLEHDKDLYEKYLSIVNTKSGIPYKILCDSCKIIQNSINKILEEITDFEIILNFDKKGFRFMICGTGGTTIPAAQGSGFQKFVIDLIMRTYLASNHPYMPNFMIIDEGFGCMDAQHLANMKEFLTKLGGKTRLSWAIIISHIEELQQISDQQLIIKTIGGNSFLSYGGDYEEYTSYMVNKKIEDTITEIDDQYYCSLCDKSFINRVGSRDKHLQSQAHIRKLKI